jgi:glycosyltransferase 2 family protein
MTRDAEGAVRGAVFLPQRPGRERRRGDALRAGAGAAGLAVTSLLAFPDHLSTLERDAFEAVNHLPHTAAPALWVVMQAGSFPAVFVTAGLALVARRPRLAVALATAGTATWLLAKVVKQVVDRGRPEVFLHDVVVYGPAATGLGFPSGHAAVAACLMTVAAPYLTRTARIVGWAVVLLVTFTRMFVGAHLPLDAAGGLLLGWTIGSIATFVTGRPA